jgi:hypothetical protein
LGLSWEEAAPLLAELAVAGKSMQYEIFMPAVYAGEP